MKTFRILGIGLLAFSLLLSVCSPATTVEPALPEATEEAAPARGPLEEPTQEFSGEGLTCDEPIKVGLITDTTGALGIYGAQIIRSFMLGMEYATGAPGSVGKTFTVEDGENTFMLECWMVVRSSSILATTRPILN